MTAYAYQEPASPMTLRQGLDEYYQVNSGFNGTGEFLGQTRDVVTGHDVCHIVFGQGTTTREELVIETLTVIACHLPLQKLRKIPKVKFFVEIWKMFGPWRLAKRFVLTTPRMLRAVLMALRMKKKWPHFDYERYLDVPLAQIRQEFGIRLPV